MACVPFNKFIITGETPQCSSNGKQFLMMEQEHEHTNCVFHSLKYYFTNYMKIYTVFWVIMRGISI